MNADFPYQDSEDALHAISADLVQLQKTVNSIGPKADALTIEAICVSTISKLVDYLPLLGFLLRSTNVRNGFEAYGPILRMAKSLLGDDSKLVLSSEWDYSPFTYVGLRAFPNYVFIGLPSTESSNPLLIPAAGHELGHSIWLRKRFEEIYTQPFEDAVVRQIRTKWSQYHVLHPEIEQPMLDDILARETWFVSVFWALRQAEEMFCDFVGLRLFGTSYLHAFAYLLAPELPGGRSPIYPRMRDRVDALVRASGSFGIEIPPQYEDLFTDNSAIHDTGARNEYFLSIADTVAQSEIPGLIQLAEKVTGEAGVSIPDKNEIEKITLRLSKYPIPAVNASSVAVILNAGWNVFYKKGVWNNQVENETERIRSLKEVLLKSLEVFECEHRTAGKST